MNSDPNDSKIVFLKIFHNQVNVFTRIVYSCRKITEPSRFQNQDIKAYLTTAVNYKHKLFISLNETERFCQVQL
jgi:hypothetical protein